MSNHTPGPWTVVESGTCGEVNDVYDIATADDVNDENGEYEAIATVWANRPWLVNALPDATLMAAAPDLLAACQSALGTIQYLLANSDNGPAGNCVEVLAAAIAKAAGRSDEGALNWWSVLYRSATAPPVAAPECFACQAEDGDHAEEQCRNAYPGCDVLWTFLGDAEGAYQDYWGASDTKGG